MGAMWGFLRESPAGLTGEGSHRVVSHWSGRNLAFLFPCISSSLVSRQQTLKLGTRTRQRPLQLALPAAPSAGSAWKFWEGDIWCSVWVGEVVFSFQIFLHFLKTRFLDNPALAFGTAGNCRWLKLLGGEVTPTELGCSRWAAAGFCPLVLFFPLAPDAGAFVGSWLQGRTEQIQLSAAVFWWISNNGHDINSNFLLLINQA